MMYQSQYIYNIEMCKILTTLFKKKKSREEQDITILSL